MSNSVKNILIGEDKSLVAHTDTHVYVRALLPIYR